MKSSISLVSEHISALNKCNQTTGISIENYWKNYIIQTKVSQDTLISQFDEVIKIAEKVEHPNEQQVYFTMCAHFSQAAIRLIPPGFWSRYVTLPTAPPPKALSYP